MDDDDDGIESSSVPILKEFQSSQNQKKAWSISIIPPPDREKDKTEEIELIRKQAQIRRKKKQAGETNNEFNISDLNKTAQNSLKSLLNITTTEHSKDNSQNDTRHTRSRSIEIDMEKSSKLKESKLKETNLKSAFINTAYYKKLMMQTYGNTPLIDNPITLLHYQVQIKTNNDVLKYHEIKKSPLSSNHLLYRQNYLNKFDIKLLQNPSNELIHLIYKYYFHNDVFILGWKFRLFAIELIERILKMIIDHLIDLNTLDDDINNTLTLDKNIQQKYDKLKLYYLPGKHNKNNEQLINNMLIFLIDKAAVNQLNIELFAIFFTTIATELFQYKEIEKQQKNKKKKKKKKCILLLYVTG